MAPDLKKIKKTKFSLIQEINLVPEILFFIQFCTMWCKILTIFLNLSMDW